MNKIVVEVHSGLHSGAIWEFTSGVVQIGGDTTASVFLCDEVIPDDCISLKIIGNRVVLKSIDPEIQGAEELIGKEGKWIYAGQTYSLDYKGVRFTISIIDLTGQFFKRVSNSVLKSINQSADYIQHAGMRVVITISSALCLISTIVILFLGTSNESLLAKESPKLNSPLPNTAVDSVRAELNEFENNEMVQFTSLKVDKNSIVLSAKLSRFQLFKFENLLKSVSLDYGDQVAITANVSLNDLQKAVDQMDVRGVFFGDKPYVMLRNGNRLFLNSTYNGLTLVAINKDKLKFVGNNQDYVKLI